MNKKIDKAVRFLKNGETVVFPTETVYGLGADAENSEAIMKIYLRKKRPNFNPLICHFKNIESMKEHVLITKEAKILSKKLWPGPLTIILKKKKNSSISKLVSSNLPTLACRVPSNIIAQKILKKFDGIIAAPSANVSSKLSSTTKNHVIKNFGKKIYIIDGGITNYGIESTVVDLTKKKPTILRPGAIPNEVIKKIFPNIIEKNKSSKNIISPGQLKKHYSPDIPIRLNVKNVNKNEALLNFGKNNLKSNMMQLNLSKKSNLNEAAKNLFKYLHKLNKKKFSGIAVAPIKNKGLGIAINDRLKRASFNG